jgi:tyrosinase
MSPTGAPSTLQPAVPLRHRPSVTEMSGAEIDELRAAFTKLQAIDDERGYQYLAGLHGLPLPMYCDQAHGQPAFLPWHRAYLYRVELSLRATGHDVMLPWWDWITVPEVPAPYAQTSATNPLYSVRINELALGQGARGEASEGDPKETEREARLSRLPDTTRKPGRPGLRLPTKSEIEVVLGYSDFIRFSSNLDDYHGAVHMWVGGHMEDIPFAAYDPIFWAHHCMIDRLWRIWQLRHPQASFPANVLAQVMEPFNLTAADMLDPTTLGYDYVTSSSAVKVGG